MQHLWLQLLELYLFLFLFFNLTHFLNHNINLKKIALIWQLMRAYTLAMLDKIAGQGHPVVENGIIEWTNNKVL